ncbi:MAG: NDP-sugar synthase [Acidobacteriota bacterium]
MRGMVLAAGRGERMRPLTHRLAKPAIPVLNRPLVGYGLRMLHRAGVDHAAVNLHHLPETVEAILEPWTPEGMQVTTFRERNLLGTAGGVKNAESVLRGDGPFLLSNGDFVFDVDPEQVLVTHRASGAVATMVLLPYQEHKGYHPVEVVEGRVVRIAGHPSYEGPAATPYVFSGLHVVEPDVLDRIPPGEEFDINRQVYPSFIAEGATIAACVVDSPWVEFGTPGDYLRRTLQILAPPFSSLLERLGIRPEGDDPDRLLLGGGARVHESATVRDGAVLGDRVELGRDAKVRRSVIWNDAKIGYHSDISDAIIGEGVILPPNTVFHRRIVLARGDDLPAEAGGERQGDLVFFPL